MEELVCEEVGEGPDLPGEKRLGGYLSDALFLALWFTEGQFYPAKRIDIDDIVPDNECTYLLSLFCCFLCDCVEEKRGNKDRK